MKKLKRQKAPKELKDMQVRLKGLTTKWAPLVIEEMCKEQDTDKIKLYNILNGSIKDKIWHNIFLKAGNKVADKLEKKQLKQTA